jgi:hypothetical protein
MEISKLRSIDIEDARFSKLQEIGNNFLEIAQAEVRAGKGVSPSMILCMVAEEPFLSPNEKLTLAYTIGVTLAELKNNTPLPPLLRMLMDRAERE